jgi:hypothetical protein
VHEALLVLRQMSAGRLDALRGAVLEGDASSTGSTRPPLFSSVTRT